MASEPLLRLEGVGKKFGLLTVLNEVSFEVRPGEIVGLVGPNGSGKTTTINVISGVHRADAGQILFEGQPVQALPIFRLARLGINRSFQVPKTFHDLTVRENIDVAATIGRARGAAPEFYLGDWDFVASSYRDMVFVFDFIFIFYLCIGFCHRNAVL